MFLKLFLFLFPFSLFSQELIWSSDSRGEVSQEKYDKVIKEYVDKKYPSRVKAYESALLRAEVKKENELKIDREKELKRQREVDKNTVTLSGLMWQDDENARRVKKNYEGAKEYCEDLKLFGYTNWRLPNIDELKNIIYKSRRPTIRKEFRNSVSGYYWSSSLDASSSKYAWRMNFKSAKPSYGTKASNYHVRCVRTK